MRLTTAFTVDMLPSVLGLLYIVLIATVVGYGIWVSLLRRHPSSVLVASLRGRTRATAPSPPPHGSAQLTSIASS